MRVPGPKQTPCAPNNRFANISAIYRYIVRHRLSLQRFGVFRWEMNKEKRLSKEALSHRAAPLIQARLLSAIGVRKRNRGPCVR